MAYDFSPLSKELADIKDWLGREYTQISAGRANPALLDHVTIESYGSFQPIKNLASISLEDSRTLRIVPWDKSQIKDIEKAIIASQMPFGVSSDAAGVRATLPQVTTENKTALTKLVKQKLEDARISIRQVRQKIEKAIEAADFGEDDERRYKDDMQKSIDASNNLLEGISAKKERDIMEA